MTIQHKAAPVLRIKAMDDETGEFEGYGLHLWRRT